MAIGKYRLKHTWYDSKFWGTHEELLAEGVSAERGWAVVRSWHPEPRYISDRFEKYILRIDVSEWYAAYGQYICRASDEMRRICMSIRDKKPCDNVWFDNRSPGWWENGFSQQLCLTSVLFRYESEEAHIRSVIETGSDWDTLDYNTLVSDLCAQLAPLFELFAKMSRPAVPFADNF